MDNPAVTLEAISHSSHESHIKNLLAEKEELLFHIKNQDSVAHMLTVDPFRIIDVFFKTKNSWLTVGDYNGLEANYILTRGQEKVVASDISDAILKEAKEEHLIPEYSKENVEHISFKDNSFDYVLCKEAYHHFPRAYLGLYEMIRVSKKGTILLSEPIDILSKVPLLLLLKNIADAINPQLINKIWKNRFSFESVGNYVFKVSEREIEKLAMGIGLRCIAFKGHNIFKTHVKIEGMNDTPHNKKLYKKLTKKLHFRNFFSQIGLIPYDCLCSIIFKEMPEEKTLEELEKKGFKIVRLPKNPYLT